MEGSKKGRARITGNQMNRLDTVCSRRLKNIPFSSYPITCQHVKTKVNTGILKSRVRDLLGALLFRPLFRPCHFELLVKLVFETAISQNTVKRLYSTERVAKR